MENATNNRRATAEEIMARPICPLTWLTNNERCVHCDPDCAWFDHVAGACGILVISQAIRGLDENGQHVRVIAMERAKRDGVL